MPTEFRKFKDHFTLSAYLKVDPLYQQTAMNCLADMLTMLQAPELALITSKRGPFSVYGQYDILFIIGASDLARVNRIFYAIIDYLSFLYPEAITDFYKTIGFEWLQKKPPKALNSTNYIAYIKLKTKYPANLKAELPLVSYLILRRVSDSIRNTDGSFQKPLDLVFTAFGSFSWFENCLLIQGNSYEDVFLLSERLGGFGLLADYTLMLLRDPSCPPPRLPQNATILTHISLKGNHSPRALFSAMESANVGKVKSLRSFTHYILSIQLNANSSLEPFLSQIQKYGNIAYSKSTMYVDQDALQLEPGPPPMFKNIREEKVTSDGFMYHFSKIEKASISQRKLLALRTQISILRQIPQFRYIFPENIINSLDFLHQEVANISDEVLQYYITEYTMAISERLSGSQVESLVGKEIAFLQTHASYQRLLLSCEALILKCYLLFLDRVVNVDIQFASRPVLFIFFDYGTKLSTQIPSEILAQGIKDHLPIILRLKMLKYKPWLWVTGLRELSKYIYTLTEGLMPLDVFAEDPKLISFSDHFLCHFLTKENFVKVLMEEFGYFEKVEPDRYQIHPEREMDVLRRLDGIDFSSSFLRDDYINPQKCEEYSRMLRRGQFVFDMTDSDFINFINAYYSLDRYEQRSAKPFISFTLSLYWSHKSLTG